MVSEDASEEEREDVHPKQDLNYPLKLARRFSVDSPHRLSWSHGVNGEQLLRSALKNSYVHMLEADVAYGWPQEHRRDGDPGHLASAGRSMLCVRSVKDRRPKPLQVEGSHFLDAPRPVRYRVGSFWPGHGFKEEDAVIGSGRGTRRRDEELMAAFERGTSSSSSCSRPNHEEPEAKQQDLAEEVMAAFENTASSSSSRPAHEEPEAKREEEKLEKEDEEESTEKREEEEEEKEDAAVAEIDDEAKEAQPKNMPCFSPEPKRCPSPAMVPLDKKLDKVEDAALTETDDQANEAQPESMAPADNIRSTPATRPADIIMAHYPTQQNSDLGFKDFIDEILRHNDFSRADDAAHEACESNGVSNTNVAAESGLVHSASALQINKFKALKLDFKLLECVRPALRYLKEVDADRRLEGHLWLNADVLSGPGALTSPLDAVQFIRHCIEFQPNAVLSLGWGSTLLSVTRQYTSAMVDEMVNLCTTPSIPRSLKDDVGVTHMLAPYEAATHITFAVSFQYAMASVAELKDLLKRVPGSSLTLFSGVGSFGVTRQQRQESLRVFDPKRLFLDLKDVRQSRACTPGEVCSTM